MGVTVSNVKIVQCTIFRWNPWTTNWIRHVWSKGVANFGTRCSSINNPASVLVVLVVVVHVVVVTVVYYYRSVTPCGHGERGKS